MCLLTQPKGQQQFKNKKQPELTENRTVWKSDNQEVKEDTFIQTSRRSEDVQLDGEDLLQGGGWRTGAGKMVGGRTSSTSSEVEDCGAEQAKLQLAGKEQLADPARRWLADRAVPH